MERWQNRVAVVTGASSGIGAATTVKAGCIVVGLARRVDRVEGLRAGLPANFQSHLHVLKCDVSDLKSVNEAYDWIIKELGGVDILVNNAGILGGGKLVTQEPSSLNKILQTNVMGVIHCTQRACKSMKERDFNGHIVIINSITGHHVLNPPPGLPMEMNIYPASKFALTAINEVLRQELRILETKIKVTSISPGAVDTEIVPDKFKALLQNILNPHDVSNAVLFAISTPAHVQIHELTIKPVGENF